MAGTGRISLSYSAVGDVKSTHQYKVTAKFEIGFNYGGYNNNACPWSMNCAGQSKNGSSSFSVPNGGGSWNYTTITTQTFTITMDKSGASKTVSVSASISTGVNPATISASKSITLPAVTWLFNVAYNSNGGTGSMSTDTVSYGSNYRTKENAFSRLGYTFAGWNEASNGSGADWTPYIGKDWKWVYTNSITLYAQWQINTYTVSYDANGGSGAPSAQIKTYGKNLTLSITVPTRQNYNFLGWSTNKNASTAEYSAGGTYSTNTGATLYAVWELAYWSPKITDVFVHRCADTGSNDEEGVYAKVEFKWECCQILGTNNVKTIAVEDKAVSASGISGSSTAVVGGSYSVDEAYVIKIVVTDSKGGSSTYQTYVDSILFTMDFKAGGKGIAFGMPAKEDGFHVNFPSHFYEAIICDVGLQSEEGSIGAHEIIGDFIKAYDDLIVGDDAINDFVVAQGRSGIWTYRKWRSGFAECWCTTSNKVTTNTKWGNVYYSQYLQGGYALPFTFIQTGDFQDDPQGFVDIQTPGGNYSFQIANGCTTTNAPKGYVMCPVQQTSGINTYFTFYIRGRWKK